MLKLITVACWICAVAGACAGQCSTCSGNSPYACLSCLPDNRDMFLWSCPSPPSSTEMAPFIAIAVVVTLLHLFLLAMGIGVYRDAFENLQLCSLVSWRYGFEGGSVALQATNLAVVRHNSFPDTFGAQFIVVMCILGVFWLLLILVERIPHSPTAVLVRRKKIIFPTRVITFIFNILIFSSVAQIATVNTEPTFKLFAFVLAILALMKALMVLVGLAVTSNWNRFQVDDPHYYVLLEQLTSKKWYAKNNVLFSLIARGTILTIFVTMFRVPEIAGIVMLIIQVLYAFYVIALLRFTKLRYYVVIVCANILTVTVLLFTYVGSLATLDSDTWRKQSTGYVVLLLLLAALYFLASCGEIVARREVIMKQLRSIYDRFICCNRLEEKVATSKYDENSHRQRVTEFNKNLLYQRDLPEQTIELTSTTSRPTQ